MNLPPTISPGYVHLNTIPLGNMNPNTVIYSNVNPSVVIHVPTGDYVHAMDCPYAPKTKCLRSRYRTYGWVSEGEYYMRSASTYNYSIIGVIFVLVVLGGILIFNFKKKTELY